MNKTDAIMWLMRTHEAIRKLPDDACINSIGLTLYSINGNKISIFVDGPVDIQNVVARSEENYKNTHRKHITLSDSYGVDYWWAEDIKDDADT